MKSPDFIPWATSRQSRSHPVTVAWDCVALDPAHRSTVVPVTWVTPRNVDVHHAFRSLSPAMDWISQGGSSPPLSTSTPCKRGFAATCTAMVPRRLTFSSAGPSNTVAAAHRTWSRAAGVRRRTLDAGGLLEDSLRTPAQPRDALPGWRRCPREASRGCKNSSALQGFAFAATGAARLRGPSPRWRPGGRPRPCRWLNATPAGRACSPRAGRSRSSCGG